MEKEDKKKIFISNLFDWFEKNKRNFIWRETRNPYVILISEIFLQKTRADVVSEFIPEFLSKYPNFEEIAGDSIRNIENSIKKLGLHKQRATKIKKLAEKIVYDYDGIIPQKKEKLLDLPAVGDYIANALAASAFGGKDPAIDVNVVRVIKRVFSIDTISDARRDKKLRQFVAEINKGENVKKFNWAIIDFSSRTCKSRNPLCDQCFASSYCKYFLNKNS